MSKNIAQSNNSYSNTNTSSSIVSEVETSEAKTIEKVTVKEDVTQKENNEENNSVVESEPEMVVLQDALFEAINVPFDTVFKSPEKGKYYSAPEGRGNYGFYDNVKENLHVVYVDVFDVNGNFFVYDANSGFSISEIKELHPGATLSYCVFTEPNKDTGAYKNLGWNPSTQNDIEGCIIRSAIADLKEYLSPETMEFLCNTDLKDSVDRNEANKHFKQIKQAFEQKYINDNSKQEFLEIEK